MIRDLSSKYLRSIIKHGNISSAARALYISQPYLSKFIKKLEEEMGVELISRDESPVTLTYAGERYLSYMDEIKHIYREMEGEIEAITDLRKGRLKLGINPILGSYILSNVLPQFMKKYPGIAVELVEESAKETESLLLQNKLDISIVMLPISNQEIIYEKLSEQKILLVIPQGHKYYDPSYTSNPIKSFDISKLDGDDFILLKSQNSLRRITDELFKKKSVTPNIVLETSNTVNALRLANSGIGLSIIPEIVVTKESKLTSNFYKIEDPASKYDFVIAYKKGKVLPPSAIAFLNSAKESYKHIDPNLK
ncbi:LysR family transcriptional regulator [Oceanobacillus saliphilus]|uniref:LysR family transcriptional regulator n=1 Tax=Oceanobacillus saliphilus TaxID=2925834 RepID=UPI00201D8AF5|nr:LysR family transcriptional regulator [Oceanobacillus saliphilus]